MHGAVMHGPVGQPRSSMAVLDSLVIDWGLGPDGGLHVPTTVDRVDDALGAAQQADATLEPDHSECRR